jgi:hypothetical protein
LDGFKTSCYPISAFFACAAVKILNPDHPVNPVKEITRQFVPKTLDGWLISNILLPLNKGLQNSPHYATLFSTKEGMD